MVGKSDVKLVKKRLSLVSCRLWVVVDNYFSRGTKYSFGGLGIAGALFPFHRGLQEMHTLELKASWNTRE